MYIILGIISCSLAIITGIAFIEAWCDGEKGYAVVSFVFAEIFAVSTIFCFAKIPEEKVREEIVKENLNQGGRIMKANELMIGDWIFYSDKSVKVLQLNENSKYDWVKPIPLTPEILEKNGWERYENFMNMKAADNISFSWTDMYGESLFKNGYHMCDCKYVHTLQHALRLCGLDELADNFKV